MRSSARLLAVALAAAALAGPVAASAQDAPRAGAGDSVTWREGGAKKTRTGVVVEAATFDRVVFAQGAKRTTLDGADVVEIRWSDTPREYDAAVAALRGGDAESAAAGFEACLAGRASTRGWILEMANVGLGEALVALAPRDEAAAARTVQAFTAARDANPKSLVLNRILGGLAHAEVVRGRTDAAVEAALALDAAAKSAQRADWEADAELARAEALDARDEDAGALQVLDDVIASAAARAAAAKDADLAARLRRAVVRASVRKTWILVAAAEKPNSADAAARARTFVADMAAKWPDDDAVAAAAIAADGALLLAAGDVKHALRRFLEVDVAHFDVPEEAARALRYEALCFERLGNDARRAEALRVLAQTYPATEAARRAR